MKFFLPVIFTIFSSSAFAQLQTCPPNVNFADGALTDWTAYTGNNAGGNSPNDLLVTYRSNQSAPLGTIGATSFPEYGIGTAGIQVLGGNSGLDPFGGFPIVPTINGYVYGQVVLLGSTSISRNGGGAGGGYVRAISYDIDVPAGPPTQPYTMTYAYAMVLENGTHPSGNQPVFSATLSVKIGARDSIIECASPKYLLPTLGNSSSGAPLDSAAAFAEGFTPSQRASPNGNISGAQSGFLQDVWTKGWNEVTFDLSAFRGRIVTLTFEADNCVPGGHFAYAYVALRNTCQGLQISGDTVACSSVTMTYSIPALQGATYDWSVPADWQIVGGSQSNILTVIAGSDPGAVSAHEVNGCADLRDNLNVISKPPTIPGLLNGSSEVCTGINGSPITLSGYLGSILTWVSSTNNGTTWTPVSNTQPTYTARNLSKTTVYEAVVQNGEACPIDSSNRVTILVDPKSVGGTLEPGHQVVCIGQFKDAILTLNGSVGNVLNWQSSVDAVNYNDFAPADTTDQYDIVNLPVSTDYRAIVKSGVCPQDTSAVAQVVLLPGRFPEATTEPADTTICFGDTATLNALITLGTSYTWVSTGALIGQHAGAISSLPFAIQDGAAPLRTTDYVLSILNTGCPNPLRDTFDIHVIPQIIVNAGDDTSVVFNQPLQLSAISNDPGDDFLWSPATGLNDPDIADPVGRYTAETDSVRYLVTATSPLTGCHGKAGILVKVYKTAPDIFVPNAFTPGGASNTLFRPIPVGLSSIDYFRIYNRSGQLVFATTVPGQGWDGNLGGRPQDAGTYVWMVKGTSYLGKPLFKKGFMLLVR
jgi:hypothetical protein